MENSTAEKAIKSLNSLIIINNDRIEGYKTASKETKEVDLIKMFSKFMETSVLCRKELISEVEKLGGISNESTRITGKFFRVWMNVKSALTGNDRKAILDSCEYGEKVALETYKNVLIQDLNAINSVEQNMLNKHYESLKSDYNKILELSEAILTKKRN